MSQSWNFWSAVPWPGYPIISSEVGGLGFSDRASQEVLGLPLGKMMMSSDSDVCGFTRTRTGKTGPRYRQNGLLSWAADCWGQEAGWAHSLFLLGKEGGVGLSRAGAEPEAGLPCCSTCCSSCLSSSCGGSGNRNLRSSRFSFLNLSTLSSPPPFPWARSCLTLEPRNLLSRTSAYNAD